MQGIKKFDDLEIVQHRLPIITRLETALVNAKPRNTVIIDLSSCISLKNGRKSR